MRSPASYGDDIAALLKAAKTIQRLNMFEGEIIAAQMVLISRREATRLRGVESGRFREEIVGIVSRDA